MEEQYDKIFHYCYYRMRNRQIAEDLTQETFLHFFNSKYVEQNKELHYLYTIARNLCIDESRKRKWQELTSESEVSDGGVFAENMTEKLFIENIFRKLSEEEKELLVLRYVNEEPVSLLCEELQISRFVLYRKLNAIKKKLAQWMKGGENHE